MGCDDLSSGDFECRKQRCRAMALVVVAVAGQGAAIGQLQIALRSLQSLDRRLFVHAQHNGLLGRGDIEANNIGGFGSKVRVVALTPGLASREVNLVAAQEPAREPLRRRFVQQLQNPLVGGLRIDRLLARPRLVLQPIKAMIGIAMPPKADNPRLDPNSLAIDRVLRPAAANRTIRARFKSRCNVTGVRQHASSTLRSFLERWTSLASGIIPMLNHDSRSRESGD